MRNSVNVRAHAATALFRASLAALIAFAIAGAVMLATHDGSNPLYVPVPNGQVARVEYHPAAEHAPAREVHKATLPIVPCQEEDGSGQSATCVWDDRSGDAVVNVTRAARPDRTVILIDRTPSR